MGQSLLNLAFGDKTLNDVEVTSKFGDMRFHRFATDLFTGSGKDHQAGALGSVARWREREHTRKPAPFTGSKSPAVALEGIDDVLKSCVMADIRVMSQPIPIEDITSESAAMNIVSSTFEELTIRRSISKEILAWQALKGNVNISSATVPGTKVSFSYTQPVTAHSPVASWAVAGTKIVSSELDGSGGAAAGIHEVYHDASGFEPTRIIADRKIKAYLAQNSEVQVMLTGGERKSDALAKTNQIIGPAFQPFEFNGYQWDVHSAKYDLGGTLTKYLGDNQLIALPDEPALRMTLGWVEGFGAIPIEAIGTDAGQLGRQAPTRGDYAYAYSLPNPAAVVMVLAWRGLFFLTHPEAVLHMADVTTP